MRGHCGRSGWLAHRGQVSRSRRRHAIWVVIPWPASWAAAAKVKCQPASSFPRCRACRCGAISLIQPNAFRDPPAHVLAARVAGCRVVRRSVAERRFLVLLVTPPVAFSGCSAATKPAVSKTCSAPTMIACRRGTAANIVSAIARSTVPVASLSRPSFSNPWQFSVNAWPMNDRLASLRLARRNSLTSESVVEARVSLVRRSSWKSRSPFGSGAGESPSAFSSRKLCIDVQASITCRQSGKARLTNMS